MPAPDIAGLCDDLAAEHADLDALVAPLDAGGWDRPTPAEGWAVRDQIHHLGWFDRNGVLAIEEPDAFAAHAGTMLAEFETFEAKLAAEARSMPAGELLAWWRDGRGLVLSALRAADPTLKVPWYGPP